MHTANELHLPVGVPAEVHPAVRRRDPQLLGAQPRRQAGPDPRAHHRHPAAADARPGLYRGQCAEFCGIQHANMALDVTVESQAGLRPLAGRPARVRPPLPPPRSSGRLRAMSRRANARLPQHRRARRRAARSAPDLTPFRQPPDDRRGHAADEPRQPLRLGRRSAGAQARQQDAGHRPRARRAARGRRLSGEAAMNAPDARPRDHAARRPGPHRRRSSHDRLDATWRRPDGLIGWLVDRRPQGDRPALHRHRLGLPRARRRARRCSCALQLARPDSDADRARTATTRSSPCTARR